jgi:uncharacterized membrane protein
VPSKADAGTPLVNSGEVGEPWRNPGIPPLETDPMTAFLLVLHVLFAAITIGALFAETLAMVMAHRLTSEPFREAAWRLLQRMHRGVAYPAAGVAVVSGFALAGAQGVLGEGWVAWKLVLVVLLVGLVLWARGALRQGLPPKPVALLLHIGTFALSAPIVAFAALKPF